MKKRFLFFGLTGFDGMHEKPTGFFIVFYPFSA